MKTKTLYRPVGLKELELIASTGFKAFPPRLEWQPIFYPVLNQPYAEQIASAWNTNDAFSGYCGVVTSFEIMEAHFFKYELQNVGGTIHDELWIPAEELELFNENIIGEIKVVNAFFGTQFTMPESEQIANELQRFKK